MTLVVLFLLHFPERYLWDLCVTTCIFIEIKVCGTPAEECSEFATCADTGPGTYTCTCKEGYTGDGKTCEGAKVFSSQALTFSEPVSLLPTCNIPNFIIRFHKKNSSERKRHILLMFIIM